jgi:methylmalonyl-CoA mutase N-terminal domain/subunit
MPKFHSFLEDTYYFSESGLNSVEEMALGFVEIRHIVRDLLARGVDIDSFAPRIAILVNCRMDLFEEVAKIRATRRLFAKMMREEFGAQDPRSWAVAVTSHTSGLTLAAQQPVNNIVRGTIEAMALAMAGVQAIEISAFDEAFRTPSPESHFIGLRTQQIINLESNVTKVTDPLGGSYYVESLTDDIEQRIWDMVMKIEAAGNISELAERGYFRDILTNAMERYSKEIEHKELWKVGVNIHQIPDEEDTLLKEVAEQKIEPYLSRIERIQELKGARDLGQIERTLRACCGKAREPNGNLMPPIIDATRVGATMGEIAGALRLAYGGPYDPYGMVEPPVELQ